MTKWNAANGIIDPEVDMMAKNGLISEVTITETEEGGFYVTMRVDPTGNILHLATRRVRDAPRIFVHFGRLIAHIKTAMGQQEAIKLRLNMGGFVSQVKEIMGRGTQVDLEYVPQNERKKTIRKPPPKVERKATKKSR